MYLLYLDESGNENNPTRDAVVNPATLAAWWP